MDINKFFFIFYDNKKGDGLTCEMMLRSSGLLRPICWSIVVNI